MAYPAPTPHEICTAYRHLSQLALRAVQYSSPARHTVQTRLRLAFRLSPPSDFDPQRIRNTCIFLYNAGTYGNSLESKVLKRLLHTWHWDLSEDGVTGAGGRGRDLHVLMGPERKRRYQSRLRDSMNQKKWERNGELGVRQARLDMFRHTLRMLNESMGLCLR